MDKITLEYLIECEIFSLTNNNMSFHEIIYKKEIEMSRKIIQNGWNIGSLLPLYKNIDFSFSTKQPDDYPIHFLGDIMHPAYRGSIWTENQLVFIKGNRVNIFPLN